MCMAKFLFEVEQENRLQQRGVLKRFSMNCIGKQPTMTDMRMKKSEMFHTLERGTKEFETWFMRYVPKPAAAPQPESNILPISMTLPPSPPPSKKRAVKKPSRKTERVLQPISDFRKRLLTKRRV